MELSEMQARAAELEQQISALPAGSVTKKTINGKEYFYHRWTENKKRREKYIPADELENFRAQIERRKELEQELKALKKQLPKAKSASPSAFTTNVRTGEALRSFAASVCGYRRRECFRQLHWEQTMGFPRILSYCLPAMSTDRQMKIWAMRLWQPTETKSCLPISTLQWWMQAMH